MEPRPDWDGDGFLEALLGLEGVCRRAQEILGQAGGEAEDKTEDSWLDFLLGVDVASTAILALLDTVAREAREKPPEPPAFPTGSLLR